MSGGIFWLASYPKSGNTWMRSFIANLTHEKEDAPVDINALNTGAIASARGWVEQALGFDTSELSHEEIDRLRPAAYRWIAEHSEVSGYHKIHDAYVRLPNGEAMIPLEATAGALYILRNPLDVAISFAHHSHCSIDRAIENMGNPQFAFCGSSKGFPNQLRQSLMTWSMHVRSWVEAPGLTCKVVRYEDMTHTPLPTFTQVAEFLTLPSDEQAVQQALARCAFDTLKQQEQDKGFCEKSGRAGSFFRKGIVGDWRETLSEAQLATLVRDHGEVMRRFGYLDEQGKPLMALAPIEDRRFSQ